MSSPPPPNPLVRVGVCGGGGEGDCCMQYGVCGGGGEGGCCVHYGTSVCGGGGEGGCCMHYGACGCVCVCWGCMLWYVWAFMRAN